MSGSIELVRVGGVRLSVRSAGEANAPLLILLHGFPETSHAWPHHLPKLAAAGYRVIAPDMRGYGGSDAPAGIASYRLDALSNDILGLADALGSERFCLAGHDWGGVVAWTVAARAPARVRRLVIVAAPHPDVLGRTMLRNPRQMLRSSYIGFFQLPWLPEALLGAYDFRALKRSMRRTARPGTFSEGDLERAAEAWPGRLTAMLNYYRALRLPSRRLGQIAVPALIVHGGRDAFLDCSLAHASHAQCQDARLLIRGDCSHWLHHEEPGWLAERIAEFCAA